MDHRAGLDHAPWWRVVDTVRDCSALPNWHTAEIVRLRLIEIATSLLGLRKPITRDHYSVGEREPPTACCASPGPSPALRDLTTADCGAVWVGSTV